MKEYLFKTKRLGFRNWENKDLFPFSNMGKDQDVMKYLPKLLSTSESQNFINDMQHHFKKHGYCYFAVNLLNTNEFIGFAGILNQNYKSHFTPCVDIGWRLKKSAWRKGYATEAALGCIDFTKNNFKINEIYSIASKFNINSISVMKKIGMTYHSSFEHPLLNAYPNIKICEVYHLPLH